MGLIFLLGIGGCGIFRLNLGSETLKLMNMIISTPIFEPSRMVRTFKEVYSAGTKTGYVEKAKTAGVTVASEIGLMFLV